MNHWEKFYSKSYDLDFLIRNITCHREMFNLIYEEKPKEILEVGSGTGSMSIFLSYLGYEVTSLEKNSKVLSRAKNLAKKLNGKVNFIQSDAFKIPFGDNYFDLVFHQGLLEHFSDAQIYKLLDEQLRVGKSVIFSVPNYSYGQLDFGDERLLPNSFWDKLLRGKYKLEVSFSYNPIERKILRNRFIYRVDNTMFVAKIRKNKG